MRKEKGEVTGEVIMKDIQARGRAPYSVPCQQINDPESRKTFVNFTSIGNNNNKKNTAQKLIYLKKIVNQSG